MFLALLTIGLFTGVLAGLLGIGGGLISVPALFFLLSYYGFPQENLMHISVATALASTFMTSLGSSFSQHKKGAIIYSFLHWIAPGLFAGALLGANLAGFLPSAILRKIFGLMATCLGGYFLFPSLPSPHLKKASSLSLFFWGTGIGTISALLGVGGGVFLVPALVWHQVSVKNAVATSSLGTLVSSLSGTIFYLYLGWGQALEGLYLGYIYLPAFLTIGPASLLTATLGVKLSHILPSHYLRRIFGAVLILIGALMAFFQHPFKNS